MSILVLQIIIKQWDKSQRSPEHVMERAKIPNQYALVFPPAFYAFDKHCVIDQHGDDVQCNRLNYSLLDNNTIQFDRFKINTNNLLLEYAPPDADEQTRMLGSLDNTWIQCHYNWRYGVDQGGFYYWMYEEVTLNAMSVNELNNTLFIDNEPDLIIDLD